MNLKPGWRTGRDRAIGLAMAMLAFGQAAAAAESNGQNGQDGSGLTRNLTDPGNGGVAGTGLGKRTDDPHGSGTGMSVPGPPGQSIQDPFGGSSGDKSAN